VWPWRAADIHRRLGEQDQQIAALLRAAERYAAQGFLQKAAAAWKLIVAVDPKHAVASRKIAELEAPRGRPGSRGSGLSRPRPPSSASSIPTPIVPPPPPPAPASSSPPAPASSSPPSPSAPALAAPAPAPSVNAADRALRAIAPGVPLLAELPPASLDRLMGC